METGKEKSRQTASADGNKKLQEIYELSILYDFYGELLGSHKKEIFEDYILNDLSLAEIADNTGLSRQGVHDIIRRCTKSLRGYEEALHLAEKFGRIKQLVAQIRENAGKLLQEEKEDMAVKESKAGEKAFLEETFCRKESGKKDAAYVQAIVECAEHILQEL